MRGEPHTQEVVRDTHRRIEAWVGGPKWKYNFILSSPKLSLSPSPFHLCISSLSFPGPRTAFPLFGYVGSTTVAWLPLRLSHFWKHDSWKKKGMRTAMRSLESYRP